MQHPVHVHDAHRASRVRGMLVRQVSARTLLSARVFSEPTPPYAWLTHALTRALPGCPDAAAYTISGCEVRTSDVELLSSGHAQVYIDLRRKLFHSSIGGARRV